METLAERRKDFIPRGGSRRRRSLTGVRFRTYLEPGRVPMTTRTGPLLLVMLALALPPPESQARGKRKGLRAEIAVLKARIAELEGRLLLDARRDTWVAPGPLPGGGLCSDPCAADSDADGIGDCEDPCPCDATNANGDGDAMPDCLDPCPDDATDACIDPCRLDADGDGIVDCNDPCPWTAGGTEDPDGDGVPACADPCPEDRTNDCSPVCALDADGDGTKDCTDPCPWGETTGAPCVLPPGIATPRQR
jgi:hypothetical protein